VIRAAALIVGVTLAGCGSDKRVEDRPAQVEAPTPAPVDDHTIRKRECIAKLTADADPRVHTLLRAMCSEWVELRIPGLAFAYLEAGEPPIHAELGVRCAGRPEPITANTAFRIGSVSKPITAALALELAFEGALALEHDATLVPEYTTQTGLPAPRLDALLRHRSGLGEIDPAILVELDGAWLPALGRSPAAGSPGEFHYCNAGYSVIGAMLERAAEQDYATLVAARIAAPLELGSITADPNTAATACGHLASDDDRRAIPIREDLEFMPGDPSWMVPAGGLLSSATDLARFALMLGSDRVPGSAAMLEPGEPLPAEQSRAGHDDERYGFGLRSWQLDADTRAYGHTGNNRSFNAELLFVPGERAVVILANSGVELPATLAAAEALLAAP
jgi:CubicO group peptidase (beta-lactamase class C family)